HRLLPDDTAGHPDQHVGAAQRLGDAAGPARGVGTGSQRRLLPHQLRPSTVEDAARVADDHVVGAYPTGDEHVRHRHPGRPGSAARGPMLPSPSTADPSVTTATACDTQVYSSASDSSAAMARHTSATPGVYASDRSSRVFSGTVEATSSLPRRCSSKTGSE